MSLDERTKLRRRVTQNLSPHLARCTGLSVERLRLYANEGWIETQEFEDRIRDYYTKKVLINGEDPHY